MTVTAAALCIAGNWGLFIYGVAVDRVVEIALGYYMSPLCSVLLGVLVLRERPRLAQWVALVIAAAAVLVISIGNGTVPWIGLGLGGVVRGVRAAQEDGAAAGRGQPDRRGRGARPAGRRVIIVIMQLAGTGTLVGHGWGHVLLLMAAGPVTAAPLLLYAAAARRLPLTTLGTLLYITPTLQFLWGLLVVGEADAAGPLGRVRPDLGGAGDLHRGPGPDRPPAGATAVASGNRAITRLAAHEASAGPVRSTT